MSTDLEAHVAEFIALRETDERLRPEDYARRHPEVEGELLPLLEAYLAADELFPASRSELPSRIGPYRVLGRLGRGGMGQVLRVERDEEPGSEYALKVMNSSALLDPRSRVRFAREIQVLEELAGDGVAHVHASMSTGEAPYILMDLVEGANLAEVVSVAKHEGVSAAESLPGEGGSVERAVRLVARLARTVEKLHTRGVLHRDLKPANVVLDGGGVPVLVDFGLAALEEADSLTHSGDILGTPTYMAPEQASGRRVDERADVYALGAILYELLALRPPHGSGEAAEVLERIRTRSIPRLDRVQPQVPRSLSRVVCKALAFKAEHRYTTSGAFAADLEKFLEGGHPVARIPLGSVVSELLRTRPRLVAGLSASIGTVLVVFLVLVLRPVEGADRGMELRRAIDRATMAWASGDLEETQLQAERVLELDPTSPTGEFLALSAEGVLLRDSDDPLIEAIVTGEVAMAAGDLPRAREFFSRAATIDPASPLPVILMGKAATQLGVIADKEEALLAALEDHPDSTAVLVELADVYVQDEEWAKAAPYLERALELDDTQRPGLDRYARVLFELGREEEAFDLGRDTMRRLGPRRGQGFLLWAMNRRRTEEVRERLETLVDEGMIDGELYFLMGLTYDYEENPYEAIRWYERAEELLPEKTSLLQCMVHLLSGANRATCEDCRRSFERHPELYDPERAIVLALRYLDLLKDGDAGSVNFIVDVAVRIGGSREIEDRLDSMARATQSETFASQIRRGLKKLEQ